MQITALCFNGAHGSLDSGLLHGSHCHCSDLEVGVKGIRHAPQPAHPQQGICINISPCCPIIQSKVVICQTSHPPVTHSIQLGHHQDIGQGIIVCVNIKGQSVKTFMDCYVRRCWLCTLLLELSRGMVSCILLLLLHALQYTMLIFRFPSLCTLRWYQRNNMTNRYKHKTVIISLYFNTITTIQQI